MLPIQQIYNTNNFNLPKRSEHENDDVEWNLRIKPIGDFILFLFDNEKIFTRLPYKGTLLII